MQLADAVSVAHVAFERVKGGKMAFRGLDALVVPPGDDDGVVAREKLRSRFQADAAGSAGDQHRSASQLHDLDPFMAGLPAHGWDQMWEEPGVVADPVKRYAGRAKVMAVARPIPLVLGCSGVGRPASKSEAGVERAHVRKPTVGQNVLTWGAPHGIEPAGLMMDLGRLIGRTKGTVKASTPLPTRTVVR